MLGPTRDGGTERASLKRAHNLPYISLPEGIGRMRALETLIPDNRESRALLSCLFGSLLLITFSILSLGCGRGDARPPAELLIGRWELASAKVGDAEGPGDGSFLEFDTCSSGVCTGTDFMAHDGSSGKFTWRIDADGKELTIDDTTPDGGYYNNTWGILELSDTKLRIVPAKSPVGSVVLEMERVR